MNYTRLVESGQPPEAFVRFSIVDTAIDAIQGISALGGSFKDAYGQEHVAKVFQRPAVAPEVQP